MNTSPLTEWAAYGTPFMLEPPSDPHSDPQTLKHQMCDVGRKVWQRQYCAGNDGNFSIRLGEDRFLCTPTGMSKGKLEPADIVTIDSTGELIEPNARGRRASSEVKLHLAIYRERDDVGAVLHAHAPHATAFAVSGLPVPEGVHPESDVFLGRVRTAPYATPSSSALPESLAPLIEPGTNTLLMANHGVVCFSYNLSDAYQKLEIIDSYCRLLLLTKQIGAVQTFDAEEAERLMAIKRKMGLNDERMAEIAAGRFGQLTTPFLRTIPRYQPPRRMGASRRRARGSRLAAKRRKR